MKSAFTFILLVFFLPSFSLFAQSGGISRPAPPPMQNVNNGLISSNNRYGSKEGNTVLTYEEALAEYQQIEGSPFLEGGPINVDLVYYNDSILTDINLLYDMFNQEIIVQKDDGSNLILNPIYYLEFRWKDKKGVTHTFRRVNPKDFNKFYNLHYENKDFVFCSEWLVAVSRNSRYIPGEEAPTKKFLKRKVYYIISADGAQRVNLSKEGLLEFLPENYQRKVPEIKKALKIKKLKKEEDYIKVMNQF